MLVSIVVPVYNVEKYLRRCIDSLLAQTHHELEIILVDDGSTDMSGMICDEYLDVDSRIKVIHKVNGGLSSARNAGIDVVSGKYIGFLDSDDWARPEMYQFLLSIITEDESDLVQCGLVLFYEEQKLDEYVIKDMKYEQTRNLTGMESVNQLYGETKNQGINFLTWNKLYKRELFESLRFSEGKNNEDIIMTSKVLTLCKKVSVNNTSMVYYMQRRGSIMGEQKNNKLKMLESHFYAYLDVYDYYVRKKIEQRQGIGSFLEKTVCSLLKHALLKKTHREVIKRILLDVQVRQFQKDKRIAKKSRLFFYVLRLVGLMNEKVF